MASSSACWGIEIGAGAVKAIKLEEGSNGVNVLEYIVVPHQKVLSTPGLDQNDAMRIALGQLVSQVDLSKAAIAVSVPGHSAFARFTKLPPVEPKKVPAIVKFEAVQQIPFPLDQVEWDYQTFVSPDSPDVEVGIFAITRDRIMERLQMLQDVGITPDYVNLSPVAAYNALAYDLQFSEQTPGTLILDVGTTSTDVIIAESGRVWVRTFPIGGHQFTDALVNTFKLTYPKAEKLKREADEGPNARHVFQAMRSVFTDLAQDVQRSIGYYQSLHKDAKIVRLVGMGSTFQLPGLRKYLKQQLSMDVYRLEEFKRINTDAIKDPARQAHFKDAALQLSTAYGLALQGLGLNAINANLMPTVVVRESMWKTKSRWFAAAAGLAVLAGGAMFIRPFVDSTAIAGSQRPVEIDKAINELNEAKRFADEAKVLGSGETDFRAANLLGLTQAREIHSHLINDLGLMMASAENVAASWQKPEVAPPPGTPGAFTLRAFKTNYLAPGADAPAPKEGESASEAAKPEEGYLGKITVELQASTYSPEARRFAIATLQKWLKENTKRDGVPYEIVPPDVRDLNVDELGGLALASDQSGESTQAPVDSGPLVKSEGATQEELRRAFQNSRSEGAQVGGGRSRRPSGHASGDDGGGMEERSDPGDAGGNASSLSSGESGTNADIEQIAPLTSLKPAKTDKLKSANVTLRWTVKILAPAKPAENAGETPKKEGKQ
ncbi:MAG: type IV pilus assembly protein PilM [Phycisphaerales bacterium]|nr:type IV pilus assembly protein PilM [Phycisphaerales bacterium]